MKDRTSKWIKRIVLTTGSSIALAVAANAAAQTQPQTSGAAFGPANPFYAPSTLPFGAPPFDKIKDSDYQPAIDAGMAQQLEEVEKITNNPEPPTFENTILAYERSGRLLDRVWNAFDCVTSANIDDDLQKLQENVDKLQRFCADEKNFKTPVMTAIEQLFGNED